MYFLPISLAIFLLFILLLPFLFLIMPAVAFSKLGLSPLGGIAFYFFCLVGSLINIPVYREETGYQVETDDFADFVHRLFGIRVPAVQKRIIALNVGGAILPGILSIYLLFTVDLKTTVLATAIVTLFSYMLSKPVKGVGIVIPAFIPPIIAALAALLFAGRENAPAVAYISGVLGTLIGADILRLHQVKRSGLVFLSVGGAGVFDGIFIVGIVAVLLA
jgi:uncharacterized membrane protein